MSKTSKPVEKLSSIEMLSRASQGRPPPVERMPLPTVRNMIPMRDDACLDTWIWLPADLPGPFPTILFRTPYREHWGWARYGCLKYRAAGYAIVIQLIRGVGTSEGTLTFNSPYDRTDGYDTIEWIAAQQWSSGAVGMDGGSYLGMTQLSAAMTSPPHLRCIVPSVPAADFFRNEVPFFGGAFCRQHTLGWPEIVAADSPAELTPGLWGDTALLGAPEAWARLTSRPASAAAAGILKDDMLVHYTDVLAHTTLDDWWRERRLDDADYAAITTPLLLITGNFDFGGSPHVWRELEAHAPPSAERMFLIGPWDHGQVAAGGGSSYGAHDFGQAPQIDPFAVRLAFYDRHLKGIGDGPDLGGRVKVFITGANEWRSFDALPPPEVAAVPLYLRSAGRANSCRGDGSLSWTKPDRPEKPDSFVTDPFVPFVPVAASLDPRLVLDLREIERSHDILAYTTEPLTEPLTLLGEFDVHLYMAADAPDCDVVCWLAQANGDRQTIRLSNGVLRLRYREGMDREVLLTPDEPVLAKVRMGYVGHRLPAGSQLRLVVGSSLFPRVDPNPNTGGPIGSAVEMRIARETVFHDPARPSHILLPVLHDG